MDHQRKEELKKNDLADVIEKKLVDLKPHANTIGLVALLLTAVVGGGLWWVVSNQNKEEQAWTDLHAAAFQAQTNDSTQLLEQTAAKPENAKTLPGLWARQIAADKHLNDGLRELEFEREKGAERIAEALEEFRFVSENTDKIGQQLLWSRATYGMARAAESTGDFETAKAAYEAIVDTMKDSPLAEAAEAKIAVLNDPSTVAWFAEYKTRKQAGAQQQQQTGEAPGSDTGLPARPDFSFPEISVPDPKSITGEEPPAPPEGEETEEAKERETDSEEAPPAPPEETEESKPEVKQDGGSDEKAAEEKSAQPPSEEGAADEKASEPADSSDSEPKDSETADSETAGSETEESEESESEESEE